MKWFQNELDKLCICWDTRRNLIAGRKALSENYCWKFLQVINWIKITENKNVLKRIGENELFPTDRRHLNDRIDIQLKYIPYKVIVY